MREAAFESVADVQVRLHSVSYLADPTVAMVLFLADRLRKPILVEGPTGVGKTELAKALAACTGAELVRLQCHEGLDDSKTLYDWNYRKQLLRIQVEARRSQSWNGIAEDLFSERFLLERPLLRAFRAAEPVVLLIDEVDRIEIEAEALLLEALSEFQISIPELGTVQATQDPFIVLTSNETRELSEALRRRCLYLPLGNLDGAREQEIVETRVVSTAG